MLRNFTSFIKTKTIVSKKYKRCLDNFQGENQQQILYRINFGDLLKDSGDILLCPLSSDFKPSNPLSRKILEKEGKWLSESIKNIYDFHNLKNQYREDKLGFTINAGAYIGSEHVAFMPCRKLKYRGILFVSVDFYSENREEINAKRIAEAFEVAAKYKCKKLSCPRNFLYGASRTETGFYDLEQELEKVIENVSNDIQIDFVIEYVVKKDFFTFREYADNIVYYDFSTSIVEYLPESAEILPFYRSVMKKIRTVHSLNNGEVRLIHKILTPDHLNKKQLFRAFRKLRKIMGDYEETGTDHCNDGFAFYLLGLCNEMPWMFNELLVCIKDFYKKEGYAENLDEFIFKERFSDLKKFNKILLKGRENDC